MSAAVDSLSPVQARVLAVLVEKQHTVPDTYPLTLNSLVAGCNQKTSREPVMDLTEPDVLAALDELRANDWTVEISGSRVARYSHSMGRVLALPAASVALMATLILRGPQTVAELRANSERLYKFADLSSVEAYLDELAARPAQSLVRLMPRAPGARESRWAHLLSGEPVMPLAGAVAESGGSLREELAAVRAELAELRAEVAALKTHTGFE